ncbi:MAG: CoB--CoM heterodisulfide reductase iron-sulfur subunit A family protein [bacterium]|nr:CoB--CoM heterodisulfide reductase iron-sulfur subunit A family protein [bacterium]
MGENTPIGSVLIVGGGIAGIQSALDLAESGFYVYLVEEGPSIGGVMAQLDKTFPTNDCSLCILSPKLVECGRHLNVKNITYSEIIGFEGTPGNFKVKIRKKPRYVDLEKCVGCGICAQKCPVKVDDNYNEKLAKRRAIYVEYPQAVPLCYAIDAEHCLKITKGKCGVCQKLCKSGAIDYEAKEEIIEIEVGAVLLTPGLEKFKNNPYIGFDNVVSSIQFERILSASGPFKGHVERPSDGKSPEKIAFLQCVGSRDVSIEHGYCSSVCCMYAIKEAIIAKEHAHHLKPTIFYMDIRAFGKGFESYYERAKNEYGINFRRSKVVQIEEDIETKDIIIRCVDENGNQVKERFELVIMSVGLEPTKTSKRIKDVFGISLEKYGFAQTNSSSPLTTSRPGVFVSGAFSQPKDIPETVVQSSGAVSAAAEILGGARGSLTKEKKYPDELNIFGDPPRIGVFICHCGINIGSVVDVPSVVEHVKTLPNVYFASESLYTCATDTQNQIKEAIVEHKLNRFVVAACSPRTHEPLFQETLREAGLNKYLFEMANIRDQCSWVHMQDPEGATEKAKDLASMAISKARRLFSLTPHSLGVTSKGLVIGGGIAGLNSAYSLAEQGFEVALVEREEVLGGQANEIHFTLDNNSPKKYLDELIKNVENHPKISVCKKTQIKNIEGFVGNFKTTLNNCKGEISYEHGAVIVATGACEYEPNEYLYGKDPKVITQRKLEKKLTEENWQFTSNKEKSSIVMIQCVGSREKERPNCSRICCSQAIKNALRVKELNPYTDVYILYRDIRTYGFREEYYRLAREKGIIFIQYDASKKPLVEYDDEYNINVKVRDPIINQEISLISDLVVLSVGIKPYENKNIAKMLKVPLTLDGFFLEAHVKLRPVEFSTEGVFVAGLAHSPKFIDESISQGKAASAKAASLLSKDHISADGTISTVDIDRCTSCGSCINLCAYNAIEIKIVNERTGKKSAQINEALCKGCGACSANCRCNAIDVCGTTAEQIYEAVCAFK